MAAQQRTPESGFLATRVDVSVDAMPSPIGRREAWLGLRSLLEEACADSEDLPLAGIRADVVATLGTVPPAVHAEAAQWLEERLSGSTSTPVKLKALMLLHSVHLSESGSARLPCKERCAGAVRELLSYSVPDKVRGDLPAKLVRRWATDVYEMFRELDQGGVEGLEAGEDEPYEVTILREPNHMGISLGIQGTHDGEAIITKLPLKSDGTEGVSERAGVRQGSIIRELRIGGGGADDNPDVGEAAAAGGAGAASVHEVSPVSFEHVLAEIRAAIMADERRFVMVLSPPAPGWRRSVDRSGLAAEAQAMADEQNSSRRMVCSWCLREGPHTCVEEHMFSRDVFVCQHCFRKTVPCGKVDTCGGAARRHESGSDSKCLLCMGYISSWQERPQWETQWCSWCFKPAEMSLIEHKKVGRSIFQCSLCSNATHKCCVDATARCGDDECFKCAGLIEE
jgi:hypothetical protein